jgi:hypothetical protein
MADVRTHAVCNAAWGGIRSGREIAVRLQQQGLVPSDDNFKRFLKRLALVGWDDLQKVRLAIGEFGIKLEVGDSWVDVIYPDQTGLVWHLIPLGSDVAVNVNQIPVRHQTAVPRFGARFDCEDVQSVARVRENLLRVLVDVAKESPLHKCKNGGTDASNNAGATEPMQLSNGSAESMYQNQAEVRIVIESVETTSIDEAEGTERGREKGDKSNFGGDQ